MKNASNNQIKLLRKLNKRKYREKEHQFIVEGERAVKQVLENGLVQVEALFVEENSVNRIDLEVYRGHDHKAVFAVDDSTFQELADTENPQGILALCWMPEEIELNSLFGQDGLIIATDAIQDPGNLGTIIRTAAWFGAKALLLGKGSVDVYNSKVVRSTAGATGSLPVVSGELSSLLQELEHSGWRTLLLDGNHGATSLKDLDTHKKSIIVVGNEANGIDHELFNDQRTRVMIPYHPEQKHVESLNAAIAMSLALWSVHN